ncbi:MAG: bestrophin family ion channel [Bacteroidota bacterium]
MLLDKKIPFSYIFKKIRYDVLVVLLVGVTCHLLSLKYQAVIPDMPTYIPTLLGTAISILLSFKMNQSYDRWWEARKVWGAIVNDSRTLVMQLQSFVTGSEAEIKAIGYRHIAFCYALGRSLRGHQVLENLDELMDHDDISTVSTHRNVPLAILQLNTLEIKKLKEAGLLDIFYHTQLDETLVRLCDSMGKAERIKSTIFPATYRLFLHFTIYVFAITLTISLNNMDTIYALPLVGTIASCFFLIEKSAYHLQDPFTGSPSDTPVTAIARTIEINIKELLGAENVPEPVAPEDFYIL